MGEGDPKLNFGRAGVLHDVIKSLAGCEENAMALGRGQRKFRDLAGDIDPERNTAG